MKVIPGIGKTYTSEEFIAGMKNGTINVEKLKEQGKRLAERFKQDPDRFIRESHHPLDPLTPAQQQELEARLAVLEKLAGKNK